MKILIKICLWILAFVPLIVDNSVFFPYITGKNVLIELVLVLVGVFILIDFFYSKSFREEIVKKAVKYIKNPLVLSILGFIFINIVSTIFALDIHRAFWGNVELAEGLVGLMFFFSFFIFSLLIFKKNDWLWFFKFSLFTTLILLFKEFSDSFAGLSRSGSFIGNPAFLSGYLLYSISSSLIILSLSKSWFFRYLLIIIIILSIIGIFLTQTRGTILGLGLGIIIVLIYCAFKGRDINYKIFNLRKVSIGLLCLGIIFSGVLIITRKSEIWQSVPGLSRVVKIGAEGDSAISRLYTYETSLKSINPLVSSWKNTLIGWGPDNYIFAFGRHFNPEQYKYEINWFHRAHNKFLDVLVMNGILGLIAYLVIWFFFFYSLKRDHKSGLLIKSSLLFFGTSFLVHLMFIFDQISTSIPFFAILAFAVFLTIYTTENTENEHKMILNGSTTDGFGKILCGCFLVILTLFLSFVQFRNTLPGYFKMKGYLSIVKNLTPKVIKNDLDSVFSISTSAQFDIRLSFLRESANSYVKKEDEITRQLFEKALAKAEEYVTKRPKDFLFLASLADVYSNKGNNFKNIDYVEKGEEYFRQALAYIPNRPDINYALAVNLAYQGRFDEAFSILDKIISLDRNIADSYYYYGLILWSKGKPNYISSLNYFEKTFDLDSSFYNKYRAKIEGVYTTFIRYFYEQKDKENFNKVANRLKSENYVDSAILDQILNYLNKTGIWPKVNFE